jgi:hypothetical protein
VLVKRGQVTVIERGEGRGWRGFRGFLVVFYDVVEWCLRRGEVVWGLGFVKFLERVGQR